MPVTVYVVEVNGLTDLVLPLPKLLLHEYEFAPLADILNEEPEHFKVPPIAVTEGNGLTVTTAVAVLLQLLPSVPVTEYVVETDGVTVFDEPLPKLLLHA